MRYYYGENFRLADGEEVVGLEVEGAVDLFADFEGQIGFVGAVEFCNCFPVSSNFGEAVRRGGWEGGGG